MKKTSFLLTLLAVAVAVASVWSIQRPATPKQATWDDVLAEAARGGYTILKTDELIQKYRENPSGLLLVDTRQEWEFRTGHMKGAVNFPMEPTGWARWRKSESLGKFLGPDKNRGIVFY